MISERHGNLLADDADVLVNTVNTVGVMGKGIALQFKRAFPEMYRDYEKAAKTGHIVTGRMHVWPTGAMTGPRYIVNFPTKRHWRAPSRKIDIEEGLVDLVRVARELGVTSIALPPLGCGNGGLAWAAVEPMIREAFACLPDVDVRVYPPAGAPPARDMVNRQPPPRVTPTRAALLGLMVAYQQLTWEWPSQMKIQKLCYFLQEAGLDMRLSFTKAPYGPYADELRKSLRDMEGHFICGFGDGTSRPLVGEPIEVTTAGREALERALVDDATAQGEFGRVVELVSGFESAYGLELLASVHWAARQEAATSPQAAGDAIRAWTTRKATMFTQPHVDAAWEALSSGGWIRASTLVS